MTLLQSGLAKSLAEAYTIDQSLRFDDGDSPSLTRTPAVTGNQKTFTVSCWVKRGNLGATQNIITARYSGGTSGNRYAYLEFDSDDTLLVFGGDYSTSSTTQSFQKKTSALYRDVGAWYHVVWAHDTTEGAAADRDKIYVNGTQASWDAGFAYDLDADADDITFFNITTSPNYIGQYNSSNYYDGYLAEFYFIDGTAYDADDFGETDTTTNQWKPIDAVDDLTFGTNGFYQKYAGTELADSFFDSGNGGRHVVTANGNAHTDTSVKKIGTASLQVDGVGDYLSVPDSSDWDWGSGDFTLEAWVRPASYPTDNRAGIISQGTDNNNYWHFRLNDDGSTQFYGQISGSAHWSITSTTGIISTDTWYHVAVVKNGSNFELFIDGTSRGTNTDSTSFVDWSDDLVIGAVERAAVENYFDGYIDEVRISNVARYFSAFTAPTTAFTNDINTLLLLHCDGADDGTSFPDSASHPITAHGDTTNTRAQSKIGDSSIYLDETGDYFSLAASTDWVFGTGEWTLEGWFYNTSDSNNSSLTWSQRNDAGLSALDNTMQDWATPVSGDTTVNWQYQQPSVGHINLAHQSTFPKDSWHHVAHVRSGDTVTIYLDGVASTSTFDATGLSMGLNRVATIATQDSTRAYSFEGYMDEIRISDTARYTGAFTPSTTAFTADSNTMLLIHSNWDGGLGADSSGNNNTFTPTNLVATDQMVDSPTNNFSTMNPLQNYYPDATFTEGNLGVEDPGTGHPTRYSYNTSTIGMESGKWYWEVYDVVSSGYDLIGIAARYPESTYDYLGDTSSEWGYYTNGSILNNDGGAGGGTSYGSSYTAGDIVGVALDLENNKCYWSKNGTWQNSGVPTSGATGTGAISITALSSSFGMGHYVAASGDWHDGTGMKAVYNFGSDSSFAGNKTAQGNQDGNSVGDFYYEPPTDYLALCTSNLPDPSIKLPGDNFNTILWTGDSGSRDFTGVGFQPDLVWMKVRNDTWNYNLTDSVRGVGKALMSDTSGAEDINSANGYIDSFDSDGFSTIAGASNNNWWNNTGDTPVAWNWLAGGSAVTNTDGTNIDSEVSANTTAGLSICTYEGTGTNDDSFGHGLSSAPELVIIKRRQSADWQIGSNYIQASSNWTHVIEFSAGASFDSDIRWNDTAPSASVVTLGTTTNVNGDGATYVAYCLHSVEGYSKIGSYEGNGNDDGSFVYTGFRPAWIMVKNIDASAYWILVDNKRIGYNIRNDVLFPNVANAEVDVDDFFDIVSNGFKLRSSDSDVNSSTLLYYAIAESPFKYANSR